MKKFVTKILSLITAGVISLGMLAGCDLITTNVDRDMAQVVATVSIDGNFEEKIYKRQMVSEYNSYGGTYETYYGYTTSKVYDMILTNLVENRIISQQSRKALTGATSLDGNETGYFAQAAAVADADKTSKDWVLSGKNHSGIDFTSLTVSSAPEQFLTEYEYQYSRYSVLTSVASLMSAYIEQDETEADDYESFTITDRTTLTQTTASDGNEYELKNDAEISKIDEDTKASIKNIAKEEGFTFDVDAYSNKYDLLLNFYTAYNNNFANKLTTKEGKAAIVKIVRQLRDLGFISESEASKTTPKTADEVLSLTYFSDTLATNYESRIISKYKLALQNQLEKKLDVNTLYSEYENLFNTQKANFSSSNSNYETALSEGTEDSFIVYHPGTAGEYNGYGYVLNLLIGFDEMQTSLLTAKKAESGVTQAMVDAYRTELLKDLVAKDLRTSWVYSGYGNYDSETGKYTFKDGYVKTAELQEFNGTLSGAVSYNYFDSNGNPVKGYNFKSVKSNEISFESFYQNTVSAVMGFTGNSGNINASKIENLDTAAIEKFRDIIYAYSTDSGSLSENLGYVYSPITSDTQYVKEFAAAANRVVNAGAGAYEVVATDYGYHILLCTKAIKSTGAEKIAKTDFINDINNKNKDSLAYKFREYKLDLVVSNEVSNKATSFINENKKNVEYNKSAYSDLITEN